MSTLERLSWSALLLGLVGVSLAEPHGFDGRTLALGLVGAAFVLRMEVFKKDDREE